MKNFFAFVLIIKTFTYSFGQSIVSTASGKSGILVGSNNDFAGISYESASDKFSFNYKFAKSPKEAYFWGMNLSAGTKIDKAKANFIKEEKWQGGVDFDITLFRTQINTKKTGNEESGTTGNVTITHQRANVIQKTLYIKLTNALERINSFEKVDGQNDTTFLKLNNPLQNNFTITPGFYKLYQWGSDLFLSWGVSANVSFINKSPRKLTETNLLPTSGIFINSEDSTQIQQNGQQSSYFLGKPEYETFFVPRGDIFFRYALGEKKPVIGMLFSYSPLVSSLARTRHCIAFGPTFGLDTFPDQIVFAVLNEFVQDKKGDYKYALTFQASFPIKFK